MFIVTYLIRGPNGVTPLILAARVDDDVYFHTLLATNRCDVEATDNDGNSVMMNCFVGSNKRADRFNTLLLKKCDPFRRNKDKQTYLHIAAAVGNIEVCRTLLSLKLDPDAKDRNGNTALLTALLSKNLDVAELLLSHGSDVNAKGNEGSTPLLAAITSMNLDMVKNIVARGADLESCAETEHGMMTPFLTAIYTMVAFTPFIQAIISEGESVREDANEEELEECANNFSSLMDIIQFLIESGCNINARYQDGSNAMVIAVLVCIKPIIDMLLLHNIDLNILSQNNSQTILGVILDSIEPFSIESEPWRFKIITAKVEILKQLILAGCDTSIRHGDYRETEYSSIFDYHLQRVGHIFPEIRHEILEFIRDIPAVERTKQVERAKVLASHKEDVDDVKELMMKIGFGKSLSKQYAESLVIDCNIQSEKLFQRKVAADRAFYHTKLQLDEDGIDLLDEYFQSLGITTAVVAPPKSAIKKYRCFLSHNWGNAPDYENHKNVKRINQALRATSMVTWFDDDEMHGSAKQRMTEGIDNSQVILVFITKTYRDKVKDSLTRSHTYSLTYSSANCTHSGKSRGHS